MKSVEEVLSDFGFKYKKEKDEYVLSCPFHNEKTPSFKIKEQDGLFHCFGCHESGNLVTFVSKVGNMTTKEAYKVINGEENIKVFKVKKKEKKKRESEDDKYYEIRNLMELLYYRNIWNLRLGKKLNKLFKNDEVWKPFIDRQEYLKTVSKWNKDFSNVDVELELRKCILEYIFNETQLLPEKKKYKTFIEWISFYGFNDDLRKCLAVYNHSNYKMLKIGDSLDNMIQINDYIEEILQWIEDDKDSVKIKKKLKTEEEYLSLSDVYSENLDLIYEFKNILKVIQLQDN